MSANLMAFCSALQIECNQGSFVDLYQHCNTPYYTIAKKSPQCTWQKCKIFTTTDKRNKTDGYGEILYFVDFQRHFIEDWLLILHNLEECVAMIVILFL